jgi:DNA topoisomerase VI subunit B
MAEVSADEIFKEFKQHSIAEFFKKNRQMLGYSGMVRSLVTVVHEYVTNSLDACEEAGILPSIEVQVNEVSENTYMIRVNDNGPGIPKDYAGKAFGVILAGTKFHRYVQQRGQQGIGAAGCTLFSQITTGKPVTVRSGTGAKNKKAYSCTVGIDTMRNKAIIGELKELNEDFKGTSVTGEFSEVKYENSDHGVYEYLKRTALSNPHIQIKFIDPTGKESIFMRAVNEVPLRPKPTKPHPLGLSVNDLIEFSQASRSASIGSFLSDTLARVSPAKVQELKEVAKTVDFGKKPAQLDWNDAKALVAAFKIVKWISPDSTSIIKIGEEQVKVALKNILNPEFIHISDRKPQVFRGGIPFVVEAAIAFGGNSGKKVEDGYEGNVLRFANRVPLLFDSGNCAITKAVKEMQWKRYSIDMDTQPVSIFISFSSVHVPYSGVGKESVSQEEEIINEIKLACMEAARGLQRYISGRQQAASETSKYRMVSRYAKQLAIDLSSLTKVDREKIEKKLDTLITKHYPRAKTDGSPGTEDKEEAETETVTESDSTEESPEDI